MLTVKVSSTLGQTRFNPKMTQKERRKQTRPLLNKTSEGNDHDRFHHNERKTGVCSFAQFQ
jgi:hypothetical protein